MQLHIIRISNTSFHLFNLINKDRLCVFYLEMLCKCTINVYNKQVRKDLSILYHWLIYLISLCCVWFKIFFLFNDFFYIMWVSIAWSAMAGFRKAGWSGNWKRATVIFIRNTYRSAVTEVKLFRAWREGGRGSLDFSIYLRLHVIGAVNSILYCLRLFYYRVLPSSTDRR